MFRCKKCGVDLADDSVFCNKCGCKIEVLPVKNTIDSNSNTNITDELKEYKGSIEQDQSKEKNNDVRNAIINIVVFIAIATSLFVVVQFLPAKQNEVSIQSNIQSNDSSLNDNISTNSSNSDLSSNNTISTYDSATIWTKTAGNTNGKDWAIMTESQKEDIVGGVILTWTKNGNMVDVDASWFIDALNSFYGTEATDSTNLAQAMAMLGTAGRVVH